VIDHLSTYARDFPATRAFYLAALAPLGFGVQFEMELPEDEALPGRRACAFGPPDRSVFWVIETRQDVTPRHVAFAAADRAAVSAFHAAALGAGAADPGTPGLRPEYHEHYFGAFVLDPDGNNVEAVCHAPEALNPPRARE
jgi:catechol 2,3-dioxygenase-like lactoylglutathione lyase family enzyme